MCWSYLSHPQKWSRAGLQQRTSLSAFPQSPSSTGTPKPESLKPKVMLNCLSPYSSFSYRRKGAEAHMDTYTRIDALPPLPTLTLRERWDSALSPLQMMLLGAIPHTAFEDGNEDRPLQAETFLFMQTGVTWIPCKEPQGASYSV